MKSPKIVIANERSECGNLNQQLLNNNMIPLRDNIEHERFPIVNTILIIINIVVFIYETSLGSDLSGFINGYALNPKIFFSSTHLDFFRLSPLITSAFLHGGLLHIAGNMLFLYIFGDNVEDSMGHFRYLFFYLLVAILSSLAHAYMNPTSAIPSLGASGAVSGVLGAYILLYPGAKVQTLMFFIFFFWIIEVPAWIFLGIWFFVQTVSGLSSINAAGAGIAFWAHIGGFVSGIILILLFRRKKEEISS